MQGIIVENQSNLYKVLVFNEENKQEQGTVYEATARGRFKKEEITPVVGDRVTIEVTDLKNKKAVIATIQNRKNYSKRPKLANITQLILVISSQDPKPDLVMLDKQLVFAEFLGIKSLIVWNKDDLDKKEEGKELKKIYETIGYQVIITEAKWQKGIEELKQALQGNINAFAGNSGVRKIYFN